MKCLAIKEFVSIFQFIIALLSAIALFLFCLIFPLATDFWLFTLQCMLTSAIFICIIFGLSTWFYNSNISRTRLHVRIYSVMILWILLIILGTSAAVCAKNLFNHKLYDQFDMESVFGEFESLLLLVALALSLGVTALMLIINCVLTMLAILKYLRLRKRQREMGIRDSDISIG